MDKSTVNWEQVRIDASINIMKKNMREWIKLPKVFKKENDLYVEFLKEWDNETDR